MSDNVSYNYNIFRCCRGNDKMNTTLLLQPFLLVYCYVPPAKWLFARCVALVVSYLRIYSVCDIAPPSS